MTCPPKFVSALFGCRMVCPDDFKFMSSGFPPTARCVYRTDNRLAVDLNSFPIPKSPAEELQYASEARRVELAVERIRNEVRDKEQRRQALDTYEQEKRIRGVQYNQLQSEFATVTTASDTANKIRNTNIALKRIRPPTAPTDDIEHERRGIQQIVARRVLLLQIVLALIVLSLVAYLAMPVTYAHGVTFLLLCVGIAVGIFLEK